MKKRFIKKGDIVYATGVYLEYKNEDTEFCVGKLDNFAFFKNKVVYFDGHHIRPFIHEDAPKTKPDNTEPQGFKVKWEIEICANSHKEAALKALLIQRDPNSIATVFNVVSDYECQSIDLNNDDI